MNAVADSAGFGAEVSVAAHIAIYARCDDCDHNNRMMPPGAKSVSGGGGQSRYYAVNFVKQSNNFGMA